MIQTFGLDEINSSDNHLLSFFNDLQRNASRYKIQWNVQKPCPPFIAFTFSLNFVTTPAICSQADSMDPVLSGFCPVLQLEFKMPFAIVVSAIGILRNSLLTVKV